MGRWTSRAADPRRAGERGTAARPVVYDWLEERERPELGDGDALFGQIPPFGTQWPKDSVYAFGRAARRSEARDE